MAVHHLQKRQMDRAQQQSVRSFRMSAPYKGIDGRVPVSAGDLDTCTYTYNLLPAEEGMKLRRGYREWQIGVDNGAGTGVTTIIPFDGIAADGSEDRLFAVNNEGIWDVTTAAGTPTLKLAFSDTTSAAGYGVYLSHVTDAGVKSLMYADSANGLFVYDVATDAWAASTVTGPTVANINFVMLHKGRIWLIEEGSSDAWYLGLGAITGSATKFSFGSKMAAGGALRGLFSWTVDGGAGVDDLLVGVSGAGDVLVYQGNDPASATDWEIRGVYFIGALPKGPKFATDQGGELYLLSVYGLIAMGDLLKGVSVTSISSDAATAPIAGLLRQRMKTVRELDGWNVRDVPSEGGIMISSPTQAGERPIQYFYNYTVDGWGLMRDLAMLSFGSWRDAVVFGDADGRVLYMDKEVDNVMITPPSVDVNGEAIEFSLLSSYSALGAPALFKNIKYIRPDFIAVQAPTFFTAARYDYSTLEAGSPLATPAAKIAIWDVDNWDAAVWGPSGAEGWGNAYGSFGIGRYAGIALRGFAYTRITFVGFDIHFTAGGPML